MGDLDPSRGSATPTQTPNPKSGPVQVHRAASSTQESFAKSKQSSFSLPSLQFSLAGLRPAVLAASTAHRRWVVSRLPEASRVDGRGRAGGIGGLEGRFGLNATLEKSVGTVLQIQ